MGAVPGWAILLVVLLVVAVGFALWCSWTAGRLDRMHLRVESARASLQSQLQHPASVATELAMGGFAEPASAVLVLSAARAARESASAADDAGGNHGGDEVGDD